MSQEFANVTNAHGNGMQALDVLDKLVGSVAGTREEHSQRAQLIRFLAWRLTTLNDLENPTTPAVVEIPVAEPAQEEASA